jgi:hypothetical protein
MKGSAAIGLLCVGCFFVEVAKRQWSKGDYETASYAVVVTVICVLAIAIVLAQ